MVLMLICIGLMLAASLWITRSIQKRNLAGRQR